MIKLIGVIERPSSMTREQFQEWWVKEHSQVAKHLPGLRKYTISTKKIEADTEGFTDLGYEGVAELWFDDMEACRRAIASQEMKDTVEDDAKHNVSVKGVIITEEFKVV
jgi:uncharacterized protein (TIGR02118 family)